METKKLGKFELLEELGRGGFGIVYRARDTTLDVERAVKVLHPALTSDPEFIARFRREAKIAARLEHPNIVPVFEFGEEGGFYYLAMKYLPGGALKDILAKQGHLTFDRAMAITRDIATALEYAYSQPEKLIHRDLKPGNILFEANGTARLADFGFAKALSGVNSSLLTASGGMVGTPPYMPPEVWRNKELTPASDVYSLACVFYEMITGEVLFKGDSPPDIMTLHILDAPRFPDKWPAGVPVAVTAVLGKALAKTPADRYPDMATFVNALQGLVSGIREPELEVSPQILEFGAIDLSVQPPHLPGITLRIRNTGGGILSGQVISNVSWLSVVPSEFTCPAASFSEHRITLGANAPRSSGTLNYTFNRNIAIKSNVAAQTLSGNYSIVFREKRPFPPIPVLLSTAVLGICILGILGVFYVMMQYIYVPTPTATSSPIMIHPTTTPLPSSTSTMTAIPSATDYIVTPSATYDSATIPPSDTYVQVKVAQMFLYQGPGMFYKPLGTNSYQQGDQLSVIAVDPSGIWLLCKASDGTVGWVYLAWVHRSFDPSTIPTAATLPPTPVSSGSRKHHRY